MRNLIIKGILSAAVLLAAVTGTTVKAGSLETAQARLHEQLRQSAFTRWQDRALLVTDFLHYHQYQFVFDTTQHDYTFSLPAGDDITIFTATSGDLSGSVSMSVEEVAAPNNRFLGGAGSFANYVHLSKPEATRTVIVHVNITLNQAVQETDKNGWIAFYVEAK